MVDAEGGRALSVRLTPGTRSVKVLHDEVAVMPRPMLIWASAAGADGGSAEQGVSRRRRSG